MGRVWFENYMGERKSIKSCSTEKEVLKTIHDFIAANATDEARADYGKYYIRTWDDNGVRCYDVGSHSEFFYWELPKNYKK